MNAQDIRNAYLKFYQDRGHYVLRRAPLVLHDDPTTLFTGSGMQPMIPYLLGEQHPKGVRLADSQTCIRAQDIDDVGDNRHTTFFEMLGNWSLGDYFKEQQIRWMWEFLTDVVKIDPKKLYVTCYIGEPAYNIPKDEETASVWKELFESKGIQADIADIGSEEAGYGRGIKQGERIFYYDGSKNWWNRGKTGPDTTPVGDPCGPDSEMFYEFDYVEHNPEFGLECHPNCDCGRFMEIGNNVFMAYKKVADGVFEPLEQKNIDHGSGLERIAAAAINSNDVFKISLMWPIVEKLQTISGKSYESHTESMRVIADHLRVATFLAVDGCVPSNKEQGYVMRRLIRRAIRYSFDLGVEQNFMQEIVPVIADLYTNDFPEVAENRENIITVLVKEEKAFRQTLRKGIKELQRMFEPKRVTAGGAAPALSSATGDVKEGVDQLAGPAASDLRATKGGNDGSGDSDGDGEKLFTLYDTYGFPVELSVEEVFRRGIELAPNWREQFDTKMQEQRERSQTARKGEFHGGLEGHDPIHLKYHTGTHLLGQALREVVSKEIQQHGSNITSERLRFDFNSEKLTPEQKQAVEDLVNKWIDEDYPVSFKVYPTKQALDMGAIGAFNERYGDDVKVYRIGTPDAQISFEVCGGPHVEHTGQLAEGGKRFKILKEEASSAGIRRIKAVLQ